MHSFAQSFASWALPGIIVVSTVGALVMCLLVFRYGFPSAEPDRQDAVLYTRFGHALAGACFAIAALLAVIVMAQPLRLAPPPASPATASPAAIDPVARNEVAQLRQTLAETAAQVTRAEARLREAGGQADAERGRVGDLEARLRSAETSLDRVGETADKAVAATKHLAASSPERRPAAVAPPRTPAPSSTTATTPGQSAVTTPGSGSTPAPASAAAPGAGSLPASPPASASSPPPPAPRAASSPRPAEPRPAAARSLTTEAPSTLPRVAPKPEEPDFGERLREDWELVKRESRAAGEHLRGVFRRFREAVTP